MKATYKIADKVIEICSVYSEVHGLCAGYSCAGEADFSIETTESDIELEKARAEAENAAEGRSAVSYTRGYLETLAVYRKIADKMLDFDTILFHGSAIAVDGEAYLFTAKSGTGKSTHTRLWRELFGERAVMVNDDKPLIKITEGGATVYGTPWNGKHGLGSNTSAPLSAVCILSRSAENRIEKTDKKSVYPMLIQQTHRPQSPALMMKMLKLADRLAERVELYKLGCNMDTDAARVAYEGMKKRQ